LDLLAGVSFLFPSLYCTGKLCHKSDAHSTVTSHKHNKTLELTKKHDKHILQLTATCN